MNEAVQRRSELEGLLLLTASLAHGLETMLGRGAHAIAFRAGRSLGLKLKIKAKCSDPQEALTKLGVEFRDLGINWPFELWKKESDAGFFYQTEKGETATKIVFRNCTVRCALFRYSYEQKLSLCRMENGMFCGALEQMTGRRVYLDILHAGESACIKELTFTS